MSDDIYLARFDYEELTEQAAIPVIIVTANQDDYPRRYVARLSAAWAPWALAIKSARHFLTPWTKAERWTA